MPSLHDTRFGELSCPRLLARFGETVTYTPSGGSATSITALVFREVLAPVPTDPTSRVEYGYAIWVQSSDVSNPVIGTDTVALKRHRGESATHTRTVRARKQENGGWRLEL